MKTLVGQLDDMFGYGFISMLRDPQHDTLTVSVTSKALGDAGISPEGWNVILGARYYVRTLKEVDWQIYLAQAVNKAGK